MGKTEMIDPRTELVAKALTGYTGTPIEHIPVGVWQWGLEKAQVALAALPPEQEVSDGELTAIGGLYDIRWSIKEVRDALRAAGYRIVKGDVMLYFEEKSQ